MIYYIDMIWIITVLLLLSDTSHVICKMISKKLSRDIWYTKICPRNSGNFQKFIFFGTLGTSSDRQMTHLHDFETSQIFWKKVYKNIYNILHILPGIKLYILLVLPYFTNKNGQIGRMFSSKPEQIYVFWATKKFAESGKILFGTFRIRNVLQRSGPGPERDLPKNGSRTTLI